MAPKINVMFAEYCYCHIGHVSPLKVSMLFTASISSASKVYHHCIMAYIYSTLCIHWQTVTLYRFCRLQKPVLILRDVGRGEIISGFYALSTAEFAASCVKCMPPCLSFSLQWFQASQGHFKSSLPVLHYGS